MISGPLKPQVCGPFVLFTRAVSEVVNQVTLSVEKCMDWLKIPQTWLVLPRLTQTRFEARFRDPTTKTACESKISSQNRA